MASHDELRELLDYPNETLEVEYKSTMNLQDAEHKAALARHIAALANHGGGKIVFGFDDNLVPSGNIIDETVISRDIVSGIVKRYLDPPPPCDVFFIESAKASKHPVIVVPSHGSVPICAKAGGPERNGKPVGITQGCYYIRKTGPCSEPILTPGEWQPVIRRCAMHDRTALLAAISGALNPEVSQESDTEKRLKKWHSATRQAFESRLPNKKTENDLGSHNLQFTYIIERLDDECLPTNQLERTLGEINNEVNTFISSGWSMFYIFNVQELNPYWTSDESNGIEEDFLECSLLDQETIGDASDFWRVSPCGSVSLIRDLWEDSPMVQREGDEPYQRIDPLLLTRSLAEIIRHARTYAARFNQATRVSFMCEWRGLLNRRIQRIGGYRFGLGRISKTDQRISKGSWPILELDQWPRVVSALAAPVARSFGAEDAFTPEQISRHPEAWSRI